MAAFGAFGQSNPSPFGNGMGQSFGTAQSQNGAVNAAALQRDFQDLATLPPLMQKEVIKVVTKQHYYMSSRRAKEDLVRSFYDAQAAAERVYNAKLRHGYMPEGTLNYAVQEVVTAMSEIRDPKDVEAVDIVFQSEIKAKKLLLQHLMTSVCPAGLGGGGGGGMPSHGQSHHGPSQFGMHGGGHGMGGRGGGRFGGGQPRNLNMRHTRPMGGGHGGFGGGRGGYRPPPRMGGRGGFGGHGRPRGAGPGRGRFGGGGHGHFRANEDEFGDDYQYEDDSVYDEDAYNDDGLDYYYRSGQTDDDFYGRRRLLEYGEDNEFMEGSGGLDMDSGMILRLVLFIGFIGLICLIAVVYRFKKRKSRMKRVYRDIHVPLMAEDVDEDNGDD